jgi:hypothetical protein
VGSRPLDHFAEIRAGRLTDRGGYSPNDPGAQTTLGTTLQLLNIRLKTPFYKPGEGESSARVEALGMPQKVCLFDVFKLPKTL